MGLDGIPNRIAHFFQDLPQSPDSKNTRRIGLHLSKSQAFTAGLGAEARVLYIDGTGFADCRDKANAFIEANLPGCTI